jgi:hypothetical protein
MRIGRNILDTFLQGIGIRLQERQQLVHVLQAFVQSGNDEASQLLGLDCRCSHVGTTTCDLGL